MENTTIKPIESTKEINGELTYEDKVIQKIIGTALENVDGLLTVDGGFFSNIKDKLVNSGDMTSGISTEVGKKQVAVDMDIVAEYDKDIHVIYEQMKHLIAEEVQKMTHLDVIEVNVNVVDIKTSEEYKAESKTVQDKVASAAHTTGQFASEQTNRAKDILNSQTDKINDDLETEPRVE
ncbi:Asp23/Gls24 family envelope stress response protein [Enterococcus dongliensis]|uniref:Stress response regulator gls24 homolog n=1 Tax=Enterococcus dongliensis TaxID=2559925 RepID=A0AAP5KNB8_9ENTE|nr:Asp23/Gls24 family envelope stress response protein [Enterococcus dongliensis]MDT2595456.1 Asp23/Gls24 family envelope stress response protein [Enterococcus dongliensis]MDT2603330.1 Asp23/Gls24 family envelope stress response protein [Enterococcus dongliensis]MDT2612697.1 Asp23/Gls24 family envelope stress response protein [Enterococcus dongliensis]MDT2633691.1 Asp23/Gls24 family envelope stress response protein [Enterococcus dongliensis]MDT2635935.1 Asp23/Gls24 family envelope stress respo